MVIHRPAWAFPTARLVFLASSISRAFSVPHPPSTFGQYWTQAMTNSESKCLRSQCYTRSPALGDNVLVARRACVSCCGGWGTRPWHREHVSSHDLQGEGILLRHNVGGKESVFAGPFICPTMQSPCDCSRRLELFPHRMLHHRAPTEQNHKRPIVHPLEGTWV